jgi:hypothetical protein
MTDLKDFHDNLERMNNAQSNINIQNNIDNFAIEFANWLLDINEEYRLRNLLKIFKEQRK